MSLHARAIGALRRLAIPAVAALLAAAIVPMSPAQVLDPPADPRTYSNDRDLARERLFAEREADWRNGAVVYQVIVDRFVPPADPKAKRKLYPAPKKLRGWEETPKKGTFLDDAKVWSHEIDFWGGDLRSLATKLDYVKGLRVDVLYLNPIHLAYTNHKYDAQDYFEVSPEYGTRDDVRKLAADTEKMGLKLVLDGVFNHMGRTSPKFQEALKDPKSEWRDWFYIDKKKYKEGYRAWVDVPNLPELNLENPKVRARLWGDPDSVIQGYLRDGVDGWRLDVAFDIGFRHLSELTLGAHTAKPGSLVIGEVWNYPEEWMPSLDGIMNMTARQLILETSRGSMTAPAFGRAIERMVADTGTDPLLKSWIVLDNHDTPRLNTFLREDWQRRIAQVLQFTVPGAPQIYYGVEVGMEGGDDPENRAPMRWDLVNKGNKQLDWMKKLIAARQDSRALRIGDFRLLDSERVLAFIRQTDRVSELRMVLANTTDTEQTEVLMIRDSKLMSYAMLEDMLTGTRMQGVAGTITVKVPARTAMILRPVMSDGKEYTPFKRVR